MASDSKSMAFSSKSKIPLELYPLIIGHIDSKKDLLSMLVSSKAIFADVERRLYNSIWFTSGHRLGDKRHILFLESVLNPNRGHLSGFVHCYFYISAFPDPAVFSLLKQALITFTNLKQLRFGIPSNEDIFASVLALENPPFQLELFQWTGLPIAGVRHDDIGVLRFLISQHALKTLYLHHNGPTLPQMAPLQNLQTVKNVIGTVPTILSLLPRSAPIERIHWISGFGGELDHRPLLTGPRVLSFALIPGNSHTPLSVIAERFGNVEVLGLNSLQHAELSDLYRLPLHTLVINRSETIANSTHDIFSNMKHLQHIFICIDNTGGHRRPYQRWDRHRDIPTRVSGDVVETNWWWQL